MAAETGPDLFEPCSSGGWMPRTTPIPPRALRDALGHFPTGVAVVTGRST